MLEYILFKCRRSIDSKNYKYLSVLKKEGGYMEGYYYYVINYNCLKKRITKNTIRYLTERILISNRGYFVSDDLFLDYHDCYFYDIVYRYKIM